MKSDVNGCSNCQAGTENYERFRAMGKLRYQYDYRSLSGELFSCIADTLEKCREQKDKWLQKDYRRNLRMKFTFKKYPMETGIAAVGHRYGGEIKLKGKLCGFYQENSIHQFEIWFHIKSEKAVGSFLNRRLTAKFETEKTCREWLIENTDAIIAKVKLHFIEGE